MRRSSAMRQAVAVAAMLAAVSACTEQRQPGSLPPALHAQLQLGLEQSSTEFERRVFRDALAMGGISQKDYEEAFTLYRRCVRSAGLIEHYQQLPSGIYRIVGSNARTQKQMESAAKKIESCADGTTMRIEATYRMQLFNPNGEKDLLKLAAECLRDKGEVGPQYDGKRLREDLREFQTQQVGGKPAAHLRSPAAIDCLYNVGFAI
ncbi:hypothetical protein [Streptomyces sp. NPDC096030]|uniref:hypothetical protein n=1 Tax=Streptomyces sp. NPDC096030 TaxID=3155423 RepID=UPI00331DB730